MNEYDALMVRGITRLILPLRVSSVERLSRVWPSWEKVRHEISPLWASLIKCLGLIMHYKAQVRKHSALKNIVIRRTTCLLWGPLVGHIQREPSWPAAAMSIPSQLKAHVVTGSLVLPRASVVNLFWVLIKRMKRVWKEVAFLPFSLIRVFCLEVSLASHMRTVLSAAEVIKVWASTGCHTARDSAAICPFVWLISVRYMSPRTNSALAVAPINNKIKIYNNNNNNSHCCTYTSWPSRVKILGRADPVATRNWSPVKL